LAAISWGRVGAGHANGEFGAVRNGGKIAFAAILVGRLERERKAAFQPSRLIGPEIVEDVSW
jgi:hypothetical protein